MYIRVLEDIILFYVGQKEDLLSSWAIMYKWNLVSVSGLKKGEWETITGTATAAYDDDQCTNALNNWVILASKVPVDLFFNQILE